jgi:hypothetical protein
MQAQSPHPSVWSGRMQHTARICAWAGCGCPLTSKMYMTRLEVMSDHWLGCSRHTQQQAVGIRWHHRLLQLMKGYPKYSLYIRQRKLHNTAMLLRFEALCAAPGQRLQRLSRQGPLHLLICIPRARPHMPHVNSASAPAAAAAVQGLCTWAPSWPHLRGPCGRVLDVCYCQLDRVPCKLQHPQRLPCGAVAQAQLHASNHEKVRRQTGDMHIGMMQAAHMPESPAAGRRCTACGACGGTYTTTAQVRAGIHALWLLIKRGQPGSCKC